MNDTVVYFPQVTTVVYFPYCAPSFVDLGLLTALLNTLPNYLNDEEAITDGLAVGDWYILSPSTDIGLQDTLKRVSAT